MGHGPSKYGGKRKEQKKEKKSSPSHEELVNSLKVPQ
jgi:hypothetical protein